MSKEEIRKFKVGDQVTSMSYPGEIFELVWYQKGDTTCGIQNDRIRGIVNVKSLTFKYYKNTHI